MNKCPRNGKCASCKYVKSMAVGKNQRDRVYSCSKNSGAPLTMRGYDGRRGNRPVPVFPISKDCFEVERKNISNGGWS